MSAKKANLSGELKKYFGFSTFKGQQEQIIDNLLNGKDIFVLMPTGGGKSVCFQIPGLLLGGTTLVVSPLVALMNDQVKSLKQKGLRLQALWFLQEI